MRRLLCVALLGAALSPLPALSHTKEDENACRPDVMRLCSAAIPNRPRIVACLERNKRNLSPACFQVFDRDGNGKAAAPARGEAPPVAQPVQWGR